MLEKGKFNMLWEKAEKGGNSDVELFIGTNGKNTIYKKYYDFSLDEIKKYHSLQNSLSGETIEFPISLYLEAQNINKRIVEVLNIGEDINIASDIETKKEVIISKLEYVDGLNLAERLVNKTRKDYLEIENPLTNYIEKNGINPYNYINPNYRLSQLNAMNIKFIKIEGGAIYLTITDIANNIRKFLDSN